MRSHKVGFCIAASDAVDLLAPHAAWKPAFVGLQGACGSPTALWVAEEMPVGWGDTYIQSIAGQNFDITNVPNGTYFIQVLVGARAHGPALRLPAVGLGGRHQGGDRVRHPCWRSAGGLAGRQGWTIVSGARRERKPHCAPNPP